MGKCRCAAAHHSTASQLRTGNSLKKKLLLSRGLWGHPDVYLIPLGSHIPIVASAPDMASVLPFVCPCSPVTRGDDASMPQSLFSPGGIDMDLDDLPGLWEGVHACDVQFELPEFFSGALGDVESRPSEPAQTMDDPTGRWQRGCVICLCCRAFAHLVNHDPQSIE